MINHSKRALIVFVKAPIQGEVKTRIAKSTSEAIATEIYKSLLDYTFSVCEKLDELDVFIFSNKPFKHNQVYNLHLQKGRDLGDKMHNAFEEISNRGYKKLVLIGSDCLEMNDRTILSAFDALDRFDVVVNPVEDGGYCLLGLNQPNGNLFSGVNWSTSLVHQQTIQKVQSERLTFVELPVKRDVDYWEDLPLEWKTRFKKE